MSSLDPKWWHDGQPFEDWWRKDLFDEPLSGIDIPPRESGSHEGGDAAPDLVTNLSRFKQRVAFRPHLATRVAGYGLAGLLLLGGVFLCLVSFGVAHALFPMGWLDKPLALGNFVALLWSGLAALAVIKLSNRTDQIERRVVDRIVLGLINHFRRGSRGSLESWQRSIRLVVAAAWVAGAVAGIILLSSYMGWALDELARYMGFVDARASFTSVSLPRLLAALVAGSAGLIVVGGLSLSATEQMRLAAEFGRYAKTPEPSAQRFEAPAPAALEPSHDALTIAHLSDLHICPTASSYRVETSKSKNPMHGGNSVLAELAVPEGVDAMVLTGDLTDTGHPQEYIECLRLLGHPTIARVFVPGNHDLNFSSRDYWRVEGSGRIARALRCIRTLSFMSHIQGKTAELVVGSTVTSLSSYVAHYRGEFVKLLDLIASSGASSLPWWSSEVRAQARVVMRLYQNAFPQVVTIKTSGARQPAVAAGASSADEVAAPTSEPTSSGAQVAFVLFDSNVASTSVITNALGRIEDDALDRARTLLLRHAEKPVVMCLHHHLVLQNDGRGIKDAAMLVENRAAVFDLLSQVNAPHVVLHGHKHISQWLDVADVDAQVVSAPSATLGCEHSGGPAPVVPTYDILRLPILRDFTARPGIRVGPGSKRAYQ